MKKSNIIAKLEKEGYKVVGTKFDYWQVAGVKLSNGDIFALADGIYHNGSYGCIENFKYQDVLDALETAEKRNSLCKGAWNGDTDKILSMGNYFLYLEGKYPFSK